MLTLKAPAKINWFLHVYGLRNNGYHEIKSLIQKVSLYDVLTLMPSKDLTLKTDLQIPAEQNLVYKAAVLLKKRCKVNTGCEVHLYKKIPVAAGLGGGSSDAALTLIGLNELWSLGLSTDELCGLGEEVGSDVPFFLHNSLALIEGRGEKVTFFKAIKSFNILLVKPPMTVSTHWAYKNLNARENQLPASRDNFYSDYGKNLETLQSNPELTNIAEKVDNISLFIHAIGEAKLHKNPNISNDLETVVAERFPVIIDIKKRLISEGAFFSLMSGSGPTVFGVFRTSEEAAKATKGFRDCWTAVVQTITD